MSDATIPVKNIVRGALSVDGYGMLEPGAECDAADSDHTAALIDAGSLIEMPTAPVSPDETAAEKRAREKAERDEAANTNPPTGEDKE